MKKILWFIGIVIIISCQNPQTENQTLSKADMLEIVKACETNFSIGVRTKDTILLANIYSDSAQYIQPNRPYLIGKTQIAKEWGGFVRIKENPIDIVFNIIDVRGNREILYETGTGYTLLADSTKWNFNYVNVWRLQTDGSYKLEIDTYN